MRYRKRHPPVRRPKDASHTNKARGTDKNGGYAAGTDLLLIHQPLILPGFDPFEDFGDTPDGERVREAGVHHVGPKAVEAAGVVILFEFTTLFEEEFVVDL